MDTDVQRSENIFRVFKRISPHLTRKWEILFTVLGFDEPELQSLREEHLHVPAALLVETGLRRWRERHGRAANIPGLVTALKEADLHHSADYVEEHCGKLQKCIPYPIDNTSHDRGLRSTKYIYTKRREQIPGGLLQGSFQVYLANYTDNTLVHECAQPLFAAWAEYVVEEKERYAEELTKSLNTEGAVVTDIMIGCLGVDDDTQGLIIVDIFCHTVHAYAQIKVLTEERVLRKFFQEVAVDGRAINEAALHGLPLETSWYVSLECMDRCERELRESIAESDADKSLYDSSQTDNQNTLDDDIKFVTKLEAKKVARLEYAATYRVKDSPSLDRIAAIPGVENTLAALDTESTTILVLQSVRDKYTPYRKLVNVVRRFRGKGKFQLSSPCGLSAFGEYILVAEKFAKKIFVFDTKGNGIAALGIELTPSDICVLDKHLWVVGEGRVDVFELSVEMSDGGVKHSHERHIHTGYLTPTQCTVQGADDLVFVGSETNVNNKISLYAIKGSLRNSRKKLLRQGMSSLLNACAYGEAIFILSTEAVEKHQLKNVKPWKEDSEVPKRDVLYKSEDRELTTALAVCFDHEGDMLITCQGGIILVLERS